MLNRFLGGLTIESDVISIIVDGLDSDRNGVVDFPDFLTVVEKLVMKGTLKLPEIEVKEGKASEVVSPVQVASTKQEKAENVQIESKAQKEKFGSLKAMQIAEEKLLERLKAESKAQAQSEATKITTAAHDLRSAMEGKGASTLPHFFC